ncbi:uncharacterized protein DS421_11g345410 [Arachis hypogaea]|nr:uncharacterized protein DS421_11g345410 [Arachis hypogaea]
MIVITMGSSCPVMMPVASSLVNVIVGMLSVSSFPSTWYTSLRYLLREDLEIPPAAKPPCIMWICLSGVRGDRSARSMSSSLRLFLCSSSRVARNRSSFPSLTNFSMMFFKSKHSLVECPRTR